MKTIYKTTVHFTILSEEPIPDGITLQDIHYETENGEWVGGNINFVQEELSGKQAVMEIYKLGSDPEFFQMDENGNEEEDLGY